MTVEPTPEEEALSFEELVEALETLVDRMADGQLGIEEAVDLYEQAGRLHALAADRLAQVQARIDRLTPPTGDVSSA
ncbi:MAG TPA: exodeoxyribonuclease VII small subunit [Acidimicrobiales bacterium]|nr:exodeoxyribonuclease VII small subunit [Acidimicrobiales bacterium]